MFLELMEQEINILEEQENEAFLNFLQDAYGADELNALKEDFNLTDEEFESISEAFVRRVSGGTIKKVQNRTIRKMRATQTTGMSKAALKMRARKAARARRANPGIVRRALRKRMKSMRKRKQLGIRSGT
jgi:hypothetical protein